MSETNLPAPHPAPRETPRLPPQDGHQSRQGNPESTSVERPAPLGRLIWRTRGRRALFEAFRQASTVRSGPFAVSWLPSPYTQPPVWSYAIRKAVGNAVTRNRLRRRLRQAVRGLAGALPGAYLIRTKPQAADITFEEVRNHLADAIALLNAHPQTRSLDGSSSIRMMDRSAKLKTASPQPNKAP